MSERRSARAATANREVVIARTFAALRDLVFRAWTEFELMAQWWGPKSFTNPAC